jgi:CRP/FNR family cyclic AMP-dependent transcriptional regulator
MRRIDHAFARRLACFETVFCYMVTFEIFRLETNVDSFAANDVIFRKGDARTVMYVVKEGEVDIQIGDKVVETVRPNGIFGEMAMVDGQPRTASAIARTDCKLVPIDQKRFQFLVQQTPYFAIQVMQLLVERLRRMDKMIEA